MEKISIATLYARYPFVGQFNFWDTERGFGKIQHFPPARSPNFFQSQGLNRPVRSLNNRVKPEFAHISSYQGLQVKQTIGRADHSGKRCLFAVGVSPHRYRQNKSGAVAICWIPEEDILESLDDYYENRCKAINHWTHSELTEVLKAQWYIDLWQKDGYQYPEVKLSIDLILDHFANNYEKKIVDIGAWEEWIALKQNSPFFSINELDREQLKQFSLRKLRDQPASFFASLTLQEFISLYLDNQTHWPSNFFWSRLPIPVNNLHREDLLTILNHLPNSSEAQDSVTSFFTNTSIALDLESDGERIFQIGWTYLKGQHLEKKSSSDLDVFEILNKLETNLAEIDAQWLIGHNIIDWDLPILQKYQPECFKRWAIWDTLLISWLLEPTKNCHALTSSEKAHQADADAMATFKLFRQQLRRCSLPFLQNQLSCPNEPIQLIYRLGTGIQWQRNQICKSRPSALTQASGFVIVPKWRLLAEFAWCPKVIHAYSDAQVLSAEKLDQAVQTNPDDVYLTAIAIIVREAKKYQVQVVTEMLPIWLGEPVDQILLGCLDEDFSLETYQNSSEYLCVTTYTALKDQLHSLPDEAKPLYPTEGQLELMPNAKPLGLAEIQQIFDKQPLPSLSAQVLFTLSDEQRLLQLIHPNDLEQFHYWLEFNPTALKEFSQSGWNLRKFWKQFPLSILNSEVVDQKTESLPVVFPRWQASDASFSYLAGDVVAPTSGNRVRYWSDTLSRLFALASNTIGGTVPNKIVFVLLVTNESEAQPIRNALASIGQTHQVDRTILRQLEKQHQTGKQFAVDTINNAHKWLEASAELGYPVQLAIEALPLHEWWMCLSPQVDQILATEDAGVLDEGHFETADYDDNSDDEGISLTPIKDRDDTNIPHLSESKTSLITPVEFSANNVLDCLDRCLIPWLSCILRQEELSYPPIILDSRFDNLPLGNSNSRIRREINLLPLSQDKTSQLMEALREELQDVERKVAPADYESYQTFLKKHWGYEDFKSESQKPAIEAIIPNDKDVLVRLPTGEGKSVLFQVPALLRGQHTQKLTLVITPLRALMADQVQSLWNKGFLQSVDYLSGDRDPWIMDEVYQGITDSRIKLLFVAPERFRVQRFREALNRRYQIDNGFEYVVFDEAHCVSQWGFEFRPDYLYAMREIRQFYRDRQANSFTHILMFSATVTEAVRKDLERETGITEDSYVKHPTKSKHPIQEFIQLDAENVGVSLYGNAITSERVGYVENTIKKANLETSALIIFVTRRHHAEQLYEILNERQDINARVEYFHAGLPADTRFEIYERFQKKEIKVLICTKAFGMGMDIPHIHWCIHLAPPAYLEDYLQEVGRIGRNEKNRNEAGLEKVSGKLLYAPADFDTNHTKIQNNRSTIPRLIELWDHIWANARPLAQARVLVSIVSIDQFRDFKEDELRRYLFWLERCNRLAIRSYLPHLLKIRIDRVRLGQSAQAMIEQSPVAKALLELYTSSPFIETQETAKDSISEESSPGTPNLVTSIFNLAKSFLGFLFDSKPNASNHESPSPLSTSNPRISEIAAQKRFSENHQDEAEINLDALWQKSGLPRLDDVFKNLYTLAANRSIEIVRNIDFKEGRYRDIDFQMWKWLDQVLACLLENSGASQKAIAEEDLLRCMEQPSQQSTSQDWTETRFKATQKQVVRAAIKLCNDSSLRIRENFADDHSVVWNYTLPKERKYYVEQNIRDIKKSAAHIAEALDLQIGSSLNLTELIRCCQSQFSLKKLKAALRLLSNLRIYSSQKNLTAYSYVLEIQQTNPLLPPDSEGLSKSDKAMFELLEQVNRMAQLRSYGMELYTFLPDEKRQEYIDKYFEADSPESLQRILEATVGEIDEKTLQANSSLAEFLARVRQEAIKKEKDRLNEQQKQVCEFPYSQNLLVNAGPGAGKTYVLMMRCVDLIYRQGLQPHEILVLAFNRAVVYEIKRRVSKLFTDLGYGSFVKRLRVCTFHSFALSHLKEKMDDERRLNVLLHQFSERLKNNSFFRDEVASKYRAILIDEFQDMNEDFYSVIRSLHLASGAGVMVIGDDDQDILLWNRLDWSKEFGNTHLHASKYFQNFQTDFAAQCVHLTHNYRSTQEIVSRSQAMASNIIPRFQQRLKYEISLHATRPEIGKVKDEIANLETEVSEAFKQHKNIAVLCRTNAEVYDIYERLQKYGLNPLEIQRTDNLKLAQVREIAEWLDICKSYLQENSKAQLLAEFEKLLKRYDAIPLRDTAEGRHKIELLQRLTEREYGAPSLRQHVDLIQELTTSDFDRILHQELPDTQGITISTIHKVKGLEFDAVFVPASSASFPLAGESTAIELKDLAAEEARLYYVALTRAKDSLHFSWGEREKAWAKAEEFGGETLLSKVLEGSPDEVFISWPGFNEQYEAELQDYIKSQVKVNDAVSVRGRAVIHNRRQITLLRRDLYGNESSKLRVSSVYRYPVDEKNVSRTHQSIFDNISPKLKQQGWLYTVLLTGRLK